MSKRYVPECLLALALLLVSHPASAAASFDLIYVGRMDATLCSQGCGITLVPAGFAIIVNTGTSDLTVPDIQAAEATFTATTSTPGINLTPCLCALTSHGPIHPGQALGSVVAPTNDVLLSQLRPGETFVNTTPDQVIAFGLERMVPNVFVGPVSFAVTLDMAGQRVAFNMQANISLGPYPPTLAFLSAARVSSAPIATPALRSTWGSLKHLYR